MAAEITAMLIFLVMFGLILWDKIEHYIVTLSCAALTIVLVFGIEMRNGAALLRTLNLSSVFTTDFWHVSSESGSSSTGVNWSTIIFIAGMMIMVAGMARVGFFQWLCMKLAKLVKYRPMRIFVVFMLMSFGLSMFIDSITVILFLATVTVELSEMLEFDPVPMIISEIFCANLGGSATMSGDPPNIIIGTSLGLTFFKFLSNTGVIAVLSLGITVVFFFLSFRKELRSNKKKIDYSKLPSPESAIKDKGEFIKSALIFALAVVLLITHGSTGLTVAFIGVFIAALTLLSQIKYAKEILKNVDYKTLLFFVGLFIVVGGLEETGILETVAGFIAKVSGGNRYAMVAIIIWISGVASAFIDNIPFSATMVPVIKALAHSQGIPVTTLAWALSLGTDIGGSATPIGASANVVGTSAAAKAGHPIGWGQYCRYAAVATVIVLAFSTVFIFVRYM
ncbi:MAG: citrate transporter [Lachnospiraceae bacterium]|uniref:Citrate transporter n=1 Tax=Candidatus Weimeria bifida TaxID=2599074 RepID=A0A6N7IZN5_9FIRM|nr:citrate transporter [Candidatus Weimeria bifida]RRF96524.1 MAG: citrate transporter [Lachnospiraceae bacterium]